MTKFQILVSKLRATEAYLQALNPCFSIHISSTHLIHYSDSESGKYLIKYNNTVVASLLVDPEFNFTLWIKKFPDAIFDLIRSLKLTVQDGGKYIGVLCLDGEDNAITVKTSSRKSVSGQKGGQA